jgi:hypothetical protein
MNLHSRSSSSWGLLLRPLSIEPPSSTVISLAHGFACASYTELGSTVNPAARTVAAANMAAIKIVFFIVKEDMKVYVYLS